jgi:uncharacterized membrane protein
MAMGKDTLLNVKPAVGFTLPSAGVTLHPVQRWDARFRPCLEVSGARTRSVREMRENREEAVDKLNECFGAWLLSMASELATIRGA